jgi:hypothetical protein
MGVLLLKGEGQKKQSLAKQLFEILYNQKKHPYTFMQNKK